MTDGTHSEQFSDGPPLGKLAPSGGSAVHAVTSVGASPSRRAWQRFRRNKLGYRSLVIFCVLVVLSLFAEVLSNDRPLLVPLVQQGEMVGRESLADARERHQRTFAELPLAARKMSRGESLLPTIYLNEDDHR